MAITIVRAAENFSAARDLSPERDAMRSPQLPLSGFSPIIPDQFQQR